MLYGFITGKTPLLSVAELNSVLPHNSIISWDNNAVIAELPYDPEKINQLHSQLGGTLKICKIHTHVLGNNQSNLTELLEKNIPLLLTQALNRQTGKRRFGISIYPLSHKNKKILKNILIFSKKKLKNTGNIRFVNKNFDNISTIQILAEHLTKPEKGVELIIIDTEKSILIGQTISSQNIQSYAKRDYEKPERDAKSGMLPPKLAQIMLNLAKPFIKTKTATIYDPFCGTGTILGEALLQGYPIIGSDKDEKAVRQTQTNLAWLEKEFKNNSKCPSKIFKHPIEKPLPLELANTVDAVVTESYLGPALKRKPTDDDIRKISEMLISIHLTFFENIHRILKPDTPVVISFPVFGNLRYAQISHIEQQIEKIGFEKANPLPNTIESQPLIYQRPDQNVGREIQILLKK